MSSTVSDGLQIPSPCLRPWNTIALARPSLWETPCAWQIDTLKTPL